MLRLLLGTFAFPHHEFLQCRRRTGSFRCTASDERADRPTYSIFRRDAYFSLPEPRQVHRSAATPANQAACPGFCRDPLVNAVFDIVILRLIVAAGIILYADIGERFRLHPGTAEDPTRPAQDVSASFPRDRSSAAMPAVVGVRLKRGNGIVRRALQLSIPRYGRRAFDSLSDITRKSQATSQRSLVLVVSQ
jgi:hypothetical protein